MISQILETSPALKETSPTGKEFPSADKYIACRNLETAPAVREFPSDAQKLVLSYFFLVYNTHFNPKMANILQKISFVKQVILVFYQLGC